MNPYTVVLGAGLLLAACSAGPIVANSSPTPTTVPSATPEPLAARVGGQGILLADFEDEVARFEAAQGLLGTDLASLGDYRRQVLQALIDRLLLAQGAVDAGRSFDEAAVDAELEAVAQARGGSEAMGAWMAENRYTLASLKRGLREDKLSAMMIEDITRSIGESAEQIHAAHILVAAPAQAEDLKAQLSAGADFAELARLTSLDASTRPAGGDLGWSPQGYLLVPEVDQAAWALAPGETSDILESALGYHIVRLLERADHPLSPDAGRFLREQAVVAWLQARQAATPIEIYVAP
ncbi:MAG TPA: peptidylprolyl isomerase [Anaerolineales bacterium]|nr:peptidylprolyl isomerase [Anaerolineales bacterium]